MSARGSSGPGGAHGRFRPGIDVLLSERAGLLRGRRVGLLSHAAAVDARGALSAERLLAARGVTLACLFGPEHGFDGLAPAGGRCDHAVHRRWRIPVHSLYGPTRKPAPAMLRGLDALVVDLQDIGVRCYTYVSTLRLALEAAAGSGVRVVVADRPIPLPRVTDGPLLREACSSFVALIPAPLAYGMTPAETALWLREALALDVDITAVPMRGYARQPGRDADWPPWIPPSPGMATWESAMCYAATVCFEAFPEVDHGRATRLPFQVFGSAWMRGVAVCEALNARRLPGVAFHCHRYCPRPGDSAATLDGVRMTVTDPGSFRPALTCVNILDALARVHGRARLWRRGTVRGEWLDKLMGTHEVRLALLEGESPARITAGWAADLARFRRARARNLLYPAP